MKTWWHYKPILFLSLLLIADKILLIPYVSDNFTLRLRPNFDILAFENIEYLANSPKTDVWMFGSSRTEPFRTTPSPVDVKLFPYINQEDRKRLNQYRFIPLTLPGNVPVSFLYHYNYLRLKNYKPDLVFIELSIAFFRVTTTGKSSYFFDLAPDRFIIKNLHRFPKSYIFEWLTSKLLLGTAYPPGFYKDLDLQNIRATHPLNFFKQEFLASNRLTRIGDNDTDALASQYPDLEKWPEYKKGLFQRELGGMSGQFQIDSVTIAILDKLLTQLDNDNITYILWVPPLHKNLSILQDEINAPGFQRELLMYLKTRHPRLQVIDFNENNEYKLNCQYFWNEGHLSRYCYTELAARLTEFFENEQLK